MGTVRGQVAICIPEDLAAMRKSLGLPDQPPEPSFDLSSFNLEADNWRTSLPLEEEDFESGAGMMHQGKLVVAVRSGGTRHRHRMHDDELACVAFIAARRAYADTRFEDMHLFDAILARRIEARFGASEETKKQIRQQMSDTFDKLDDLCGPLGY